LKKAKELRSLGCPPGEECWESLERFTFDFYQKWEGNYNSLGKAHPEAIHKFLDEIECPRPPNPIQS